MEVDVHDTARGRTYPHEEDVDNSCDGEEGIGRGTHHTEDGADEAFGTANSSGPHDKVGHTQGHTEEDAPRTDVHMHLAEDTEEAHGREDDTPSDCSNSCR